MVAGINRTGQTGFLGDGILSKKNDFISLPIKERDHKDRGRVASQWPTMTTVGSFVGAECRLQTEVPSDDAEMPGSSGPQRLLEGAAELKEQGRHL